MCQLQNKNFAKPSRLPNYDYSRPGYYYISLATKHRKNHFGAIKNDQIQLSPSGNLAHKYWLSIPKHYPNIKLGSYQLLPHRIHGIIQIVSTQKSLLANEQTDKTNPKPGSIPSIIGSYKSVCTKRIRFIESKFSWHPRYYDRVIRSPKELKQISHYIQNHQPNKTKKA